MKEQIILSQEEEKELISIIQNSKDPEAIAKAKDRIVLANTGLVYITAREYKYSGILLEDLVQEGLMGILVATIKFDTSSNNRFSTYAIYWIRENILSYIRETSRSIKLPRTALEDIQKYKKSSLDLEEKLGRKPTLEEISADCKVSKKRLATLISNSSSTVSLDTNLPDNDKATIQDFISDSALSPAEALVRRDSRACLYQALEELEERERQVVIAYTGLDREDSKSFEAISKDLGLSRERVRQIFNQAIYTLRNSKYEEALRSLYQGYEE